MAGTSVTVLWVERDDGSFHRKQFTSIPANGSYIAEVELKYARDPIAIEVIDDASAGSAWAIDTVERLKALSRERQIATGKRGA